MPSLDVESLLDDVSAEAPCGDNLEYDPAYLEVMRLAEGTPERQVGDTLVAAEEPDWGDIQGRAVDLFGRTKDLQLGVLLTLSSLKLDGLEGLKNGLAVLHGLLERHWDGLHPQLDPDDDNDPTQRVMILDALAKPPGTFGDPWRVLERLRECPLTNSRQLGRFTMRQILQAEGEIGMRDGEEPPTASVIEGAFQDTPLEDLQRFHENAREAMQAGERIEQTLTEKVGAASATDLSALPKEIGQIVRRLERELARRGAGATEDGAAAVAGDPAAEGADGASSSAGSGAPLSGEITNPQGVLLALEKVCRYYEQYEPSSPVPLLIRRARRLVSKPFLEIMRDLSPESLDQIRTISGTDDSESGAE